MEPTAPVPYDTPALSPGTAVSALHTEEDLQLLFFLTSNLICVAGDDGHFRDVNPAWESCLGWSRRELLTQPSINFVHPADRLAVLRVQRALRQGEEVRGFVNRCLHKNGTYRYINWDALSVAEAGLFYAIGRDITEQRQAEAVQRATEEQMRLFVEHTPAAVAMLDTELRYVQVSERWYTDYRMAGQQVIGKTFSEVFPDVVEPWLSILWRGLEGAARKGREDPFLRSDGSVDWLRWEVVPWYKAGHELGGLMLFTEVVTDQRRNREALRESEERFRNAFDNAPVGMGLIALNGMWLEVNHALCALIGRTDEELLGTAAWEVIPANTGGSGDPAPMRQLLSGDIAVHESEKPLVHKAGHEVWVQIHTSLLRFANGRPKSFIVQIQDISDRKRLEETLRTLSSQDGLTGLPNRRSFDERWERECRRAHRNRSSLSVLMLDVDCFKPYNDTYGHPAGDACLQQVADAIAKTAQRPGDFAARYGGEEFVIVLPDTTQAGAMAIAAEINRAVAALQIPHGASTAAPHVTVSIGAATAPDGTGAAGLVAAADAALYRAKQAGRNRVEVHQPAAG